MSKLAFNLALIAFALNCSCAIADEPLSETREQSAERLIAQAKKFNLNATELHGAMNKQLHDAKRLSGEAKALQNQLKPGTPQYKAAAAQYAADLGQFKMHADQYAAHTADFNRTLGQCHANEDFYKAHLNDYKLHMQIFHMPDIPPPHICKRLVSTEAEAATLSNQLREDQVRVAKAQVKLSAQEGQLAAAEAESNLASSKAVNSSVREQREQDLADEFGKLKEEYNTLKIENQALAGIKPTQTNGGAGSTSGVYGKIKH